MCRVCRTRPAAALTEGSAMIHSFGFKKCEPCSDSSSPFIHSWVDPSSICSASYRSCSWPSRGGPSALSLATFPWSGYSRRRRRPWGRRRPGAGAPGCRARRRRRSLPFRVKVKNTVQYCDKVRPASFSYTLSLLHKESMSTTCFVRVTVI